MIAKKLVYIAPLKWKSYSQRPHFMMRYLVDNYDIDILWVDPFPSRLPKFSDFFRRHDVYNQGTKNHPGIQVYSHRPLPIEPLVNCHKFYQTIFLNKIVKDVFNFIGDDDSVLGVGKPCCLAKVLLNSGRFSASFYDAMDDYPEFHTGISKKYLSAIEKAVSSNVSQVFTSSHFLENKFKVFNDHVCLIPNGYDGDNVSLDETMFRSESAVSGKRVIGYVGTIYHWFDWDLVLSIANLFPLVDIKLIGPVLGKLPRNLPANIIILPPCSNEEAMKHMKSFDMGLIPFLMNNATRAVDPIKYYEYRALQLPVISTRFGDMQYKVDDPGLFIVSDFEAEQLMSVINSAFEYKRDLHDFKLSESSTWSSRFKEADLLGKYLGCGN